MPTAQYSVKQGLVLLAGSKVGTIDAKGNYRITDGKGRAHVGNLGKLIREDLRSKILSGGRNGLTGRIRVGLRTYEVRGGSVFSGGKAIGTVTTAGDYAMTEFGKSSSGNVRRTPGAVWLAPEQTDGAAGRITIGKQTFTASNGLIFEAGEAIGWLSPDGRFRGVTLEGDHFEGSLQAPQETVYLRALD